MKRTLVKWIAVAIAAVTVALPLAPRGTAEAHPLGNFTINRYARLEVYRDSIRLQYVLDYAEIPTVQLVQAVDTDGDGAASQAELAQFAAKSAQYLARSFELTADGKTLAVTALERDARLLPGQAGLPVTRLAIVYDAPLPSTGMVAIGFSDQNFSDRAGWKEIVVVPSNGARVMVDERFTTDRSDALRSYPADNLQSAPDDRDVTFTWATGTGTAAPATVSLPATTGGRSASGFAALLVDNDRSMLMILLAMVAAFGFGALHALGPGHGKTVVAAYLVGSRGTARHAVALGMTVTTTHTASVYLLGFVTLAASSWIVPEKLYLYLGVASGAIVVAMGLALLAKRLHNAMRGQKAEGEHRHGWLGRPHSHLPEPPHGGHVHDHVHASSESDHQHDDYPHAHTDGHAPRATWRSLLTLGIAGGLLPCPSAIVVMLAAISLGKVAFGMLIIVAFSLGLASVLTAIGIALVLGRRLGNRPLATRVLGHPMLRRAGSVLPVVSAFGVTIAGFGITMLALQQPGL